VSKSLVSLWCSVNKELRRCMMAVNIRCIYIGKYQWDDPKSWCLPTHIAVASSYNYMNLWLELANCSSVQSAALESAAPRFAFCHERAGVNCCGVPASCHDSCIWIVVLVLCTVFFVKAKLSKLLWCPRLLSCLIYMNCCTCIVYVFFCQGEAK
jgi:hypothetical protein